MEDVVHWRIEARGVVQGVGYRDRCRNAASELGLLGRIWNDSHNPGRVVIEVQGQKEKVQRFVKSISGRAGLSDASAVSVTSELRINSELRDFSVL